MADNFFHYSFISSPSSSSSTSSKPMVERDLLSRLAEKNYGMAGLDVSLSLRPPGAMEKKCSACGKTKTPLWRNGPDGPKSLCNACGIRHRKQMRKINTNLSLAPGMTKLAEALANVSKPLNGST